MTDTVSVAAPTVAEPVAPIQNASVASVEAVQPVPSPAPTPVAPVVEAVPVASPEAVVKAPEATLLADGMDKTAPKPAETTESPAPVAEVTKDPVAQSEEPAPAPVYDPFTLPEGFTLQEDRIKEFTNILADLEKDGKTDHALVQQFGQKAVDFHIAEVQRNINELQQAYQTAWNKQVVDWKESFLKDPVIGGNQFQTTIDSALNFIRTHGGTPEQQTEFRNAMEASGLGNHPAVIRLLANAGKAMGEGKPLAAVNPVPPPKSRVETLYGKNK